MCLCAHCAHESFFLDSIELEKKFNFFFASEDDRDASGPNANDVVFSVSSESSGIVKEEPEQNLSTTTQVDNGYEQTLSKFSKTTFLQVSFPYP